MISRAKKKMKNNTIKEICEQLISADFILIFPHTSIDGDALGSSVALCRALREKGKTASVLVSEELPDFLAFLDDGSCTSDGDIIGTPDLCVCIDCADDDRFAPNKDKFLSGKTTMCIDHHATAEVFADYNHIDKAASATAEIIYDIILEMGRPIDKITGEAIYAAIITDTGNFQYSNTRVRSHIITIELLERGIDHDYVQRMLYQNSRIEKFFIYGKILDTLKQLAGGMAVIAHVTSEMLSETGAKLSDAEGISETLRSINGVELAIFAKETAPEETKFSMRSKMFADVSDITKKYGGGGHSRAAGCTIKKPIKEAMQIIESDVESYFSKLGL